MIFITTEAEHRRIKKKLRRKNKKKAKKLANTKSSSTSTTSSAPTIITTCNNNNNTNSINNDDNGQSVDIDDSNSIREDDEMISSKTNNNNNNTLIMENLLMPEFAWLYDPGYIKYYEGIGYPEFAVEILQSSRHWIRKEFQLDKGNEPAFEICDVRVKIGDLGNACWVVNNYYSLFFRLRLFH